MTYKNLSFIEYRDRYYNGQAHTLVDVRSRMEYTQGHLPNALNIPLNELGDHLDQLPDEQPIVVVCASGNRSMAGSEALTTAGFDQVYNLQGGTMVWMMNGLPLE